MVLSKAPRGGGGLQPRDWSEPTTSAADIKAASAARRGQMALAPISALERIKHEMLIEARDGPRDEQKTPADEHQQSLEQLKREEIRAEVMKRHARTLKRRDGHMLLSHSQNVVRASAACDAELRRRLHPAALKAEIEKDAGLLERSKRAQEGDAAAAKDGSWSGRRPSQSPP